MRSTGLRDVGAVAWARTMDPASAPESTMMKERTRADCIAAQYMRIAPLVVEVANVEFVPETLTFALSYRDGSRGVMRVAEVNREHVALDYTHDRALPHARPLAAIRSMYVVPEKSDAAEISWRPTAAKQLRTRPLPKFVREQALEVSFGRSVVSTHNASAPDI
jgi:hypothetical protein